MLVAAWDAATVVNSFRMSKISSESQKDAVAEDGDPFKELDGQTEKLRSLQPDSVSENMDAAFFTDVAKILHVFKRWYNCSVLCESCCSHN